MTNLVKDIIKKVSCPRYIHKKETTPHKILGLTKAQFKEIRQADVSQSEFESYKRFLKQTLLHYIVIVQDFYMLIIAIL